MRPQSILIGVFLFLISCGHPPEEQKETIPWPTNGRAVSSPEEQGMDGGRLSALDNSLSSEHGNIDGMLVIKNGHIVYERHYERDYDALFEGRDQAPGIYNYYDQEWHPYYQRGELHTMQSITKSITSALIGIAIGRGEIAGLEVAVQDYLEDYDVSNLDDWKRAMTLKPLVIHIRSEARSL
jgi:CubicO group peptidase (beta-lactamase class C family)